MLWDCEPCGTKKLLGVDHRHCPACGAVQDETRRYFPDQGEAMPTAYDPDPDHECPFCGTPNSRRAKNCVNCGGPMDGSEEVARRPTTTRDAAETVHDAVTAAQARAGTRRAARVAAHAPEAQRARERVRADERAGRTPITDLLRDERPPRTPITDLLRDESPLETGAQRSPWDQYRRPAGAVFGVFGVLLAVWAIFFWESTVEVEVESRSWSRSQGIERYVQLDVQDWCDDAPRDRYDERSRSKQDGTRTVVDCRDCDCSTQKVQVDTKCVEVNCRNERRDNGNGSFSVDRVCDERCDPVYEDREVCNDRTHEEPVYRRWCEYRVDRWRENRRPSMGGGGAQEPTWPELEYKKCSEVVRGCERPGGHSEEYSVKFRDTSSRETHDCDFPQARWESCGEGTRWDAVVKVVGGRFQCDRLTRTP